MTMTDYKLHIKVGQRWGAIHDPNTIITIEAFDANHVSYRQDTGVIHTKSWSSFVLRFVILNN
jgi:hypothetical protein